MRVTDRPFTVGLFPEKECCAGSGTEFPLGAASAKSTRRKHEAVSATVPVPPVVRVAMPAEQPRSPASNRFSRRLLLGVLSLLAVAPWAAVAGERLEHPLFRALRRGDRDGVVDLLRRGTPPDIRLADGTTPLLFAALHNDANMVSLLLEHGADPNAATDDGVTALLWGAGDAEKVTLLLERGADPDARSARQQSPLLAAAGYPSGAESVALLLERGVDVDTRNRGGFTPLMTALQSGSVETIRLLLDRGADVTPSEEQPARNRTPILAIAAERGDPAIVQLLLDRGADPNAGDGDFAGHALNAALLTDRAEIATQLIRAGSDLDHATRVGDVPPFVLAAYTEAGSVDAAKLLLARGVDVKAKNAKGETALTWARRRGHRELIQLFEEAGVPAGESAAKTKDMPNRTVRLHAGNRLRLAKDAVAKSLPLLQSSSDVFLKNREGCVSCHHQNLPGVAIAWARDRGFETDASTVRRMIRRQESSWSGMTRALYEMQHVAPVPPRFFGWGLWSFDALGYPPGELTDAVVWYLAKIQKPSGHWTSGFLRPPLGGSDVVATALAARALSAYPLTIHREEFAQRLERARAWLSESEPATFTDSVFRLFGLGWTGARVDELSAAANEILARQQEDGGWAQLPGLGSDAWATGQALVALATAAAVPTTHRVYQRGLEFLLRTQFDDGSWFVPTRAWPFQPHFDGGFPHGRDQWISAPATAWATMALTLAVKPFAEVTIDVQLEAKSSDDSRASVAPPSAANSNSSSEPPTPPDRGAADVEFKRDVARVLERSCAACHSGDRPKASFRVTDRAALVKGGESGVASIVPGRSGDSPLVAMVSDRVEDLEMPPPAKRDRYPALTEEEIALLRAWIDGGASWPDGVAVKPPAAGD